MIFCLGEFFCFAAQPDDAEDGVKDQIGSLSSVIFSLFHKIPSYFDIF
ncbi:hypothetical protein B4144_1081 [Bacillus atrophaeus]|nr:hypothetical protein B4144_1081 [Bacillus atrophaeus]